MHSTLVIQMITVKNPEQSIKKKLENSYRWRGKMGNHLKRREIGHDNEFVLFPYKCVQSGEALNVQMHYTEMNMNG